MPANIPFEIQEEIIKWFPVKSLIRFRSVSKQWKSLIDSSEFICHHSVNQTQPHQLLVKYNVDSEEKYLSIVDDDSFPHHKFSLTLTPTVKRALILDCSHGLVCLSGHDPVNKKHIIVVWNPSIRKSFGVLVPYERHALRRVYGFGVCLKTSDPKIVKIMRSFNKTTSRFECTAEVFTLTYGGWRTLSMNLPIKLMRFSIYGVVVVYGFIHWLAYDFTYTREIRSPFCYQRIISFDLTTEEFGQVDLPDSLARRQRLSISKLKESLVVLHEYENNAWKLSRCDLWMMMKNGVSKPPLFTKLFTVRIDPSYRIIGFTKNGQPIMEQCRHDDSQVTELGVFESCSKHMNGVGIYGSSFKIASSYTESLLLLNQSPNSIFQ